MPNSKYWMNRIQQIAHSVYNNQERKNVQLVQQYKKLYNDIQSQLDALYRKYSDGDTLSTTEMYKFNRLNNLQSNIKKNIKSLGYDEELFLSKSLYKNFQDVVQQTTQYINKTAGIKIDWSYLDDKFIDSAIKQNWQGGNFSTRTWANKDKLLKSLNSVIVNGIASGQSINNMAAALKNAMGVGAYDALRLARTETMHILNNGQLTSFKNAGYGKVVWLTAEDEKVCDICGPLDGKSFDIDETPDCPAHPNCRCTLAADPDSLNLDNNINNTDDSQNNSENDNADDESLLNQNSINKDGKIIDFNLDGFSPERQNYVRETITDLADKYNTSLISVNKGAGNVAGKVDVAYNMYLSSTAKEDIYHEFAHSLALSGSDKLKLTNNKDFWKEINKLYREYKKACANDSSKSISSYSHTNKDEFMAEAFAHALLKDANELDDWYGDDPEYSDKALSIINKYFKKN